MSSADILAPDLPKSVVDATAAAWYKKPGGAVRRDEVLVEIETDKVILEVPTSANGILDVVLEDEGTAVTSRQILGRLCEGNDTGKETSVKSEEEDFTPVQRQQASLVGQNSDALNPAIHRLLDEYNPEASSISGTDVGGHITREGVEKHLAKTSAAKIGTKAPAVVPAPRAQLGVRGEKRVPMIRLHKRVAEYLLEAKNSAAMLTTFNGVNMRPIMDLRRQYGDAFEKRRGIRLGFIFLYVKAAIEAPKHYPETSTPIDGGDVVYHNCFDVSMVVSIPRDLVTPVLRDMGLLGMADIEKNIKELAVKNRDGKLTIEDLTGGNSAITNGDVFGSLMPALIINPSQSVALDMHTIESRPMTVDGKAETLPMTYLALSYDHRLIDGRESIGFLAIIKKLLGDPTRPLLDA